MTFRHSSDLLHSFTDFLLLLQRWFFYPPDQEPHFHPNSTTLSWVNHTYPHLGQQEAPLECTVHPGEVSASPRFPPPEQEVAACKQEVGVPALFQVIYFPDHWWHATLNLDTSVFMSTFLG